MRHFAYMCLTQMQKQDRDPLALQEERLDRYLAGLLGPLSMHCLRAVATLLAMRHFYGFLAATNIIDKGEHRRAKRICDDLWSRLQQRLADSWSDYAFLNRYL